MKFSKRNITLISASSLFLSAIIFVFAELGGYGVNGPATAPNSLEHGLVGYWDFEEGGGQIIKDKSGNGNDITLGTSSLSDSADPVFVSGFSQDGPGGTGASFDGINDSAFLTDSPSLNLTTGLTIGGWVNSRFLATDVFSLIGKTAGGAADKHHYRLATNGPLLTFVIGDDAGANDSLSQASLFTGYQNQWVYITATYDKGLMKMYRNGVLMTSKNSAITSLKTSSSNFEIGKYPNHASGYFNGSMDEVRIYNRALSDDEIRLLYNQKKPILHLKMDEGSGANLYDESFNNYDAKVYNRINTAVSGTSNTLYDNDITWTVNEFTGREVSIVYGTGTGQTRRIISNTNNTLTVSPDWDIVPINNSRYAMTLKGSDVWTTREAQSAVTLLDNAGYIGFAPAWAPISGTGDFALEAWIKTSVGTRQIIMAQRSIAGVNGEYLLEVNDGGKIYYWDFNGAYGHRLYSNKLINDNVWHHVVFTRKGTTGSIYIDGILDSTSTATAINIVSTLDFEIGVDFRDAINYFNGSLDDVRIYNYARTADEVLADYNDGMAVIFGKESYDLNQGLVCYWDFEEGEGQTVKDKSGNGNDGIRGADANPGADDPSFAAGHDSFGPGGTGMFFNGQNNILQALDSSTLDVSGEITLSTWFNTQDSWNGRTLIGKSQAYALYLLYPNKLAGYVYSGGWKKASSIQGVYTSNTWYHLAMVYKPSEGKIKLFLNGQEVQYESQDAVSGSINNSTGDFGIGLPTISANITRGSMDEVRIYNRALSENEIRYLYNRKKPVLEWNFNEGSGSVAGDGSFHNNDGTVHGASWITGKNDSALSLNGTSDYVSVPDSSVLNFGASMSAFIWVKGGAQSNKIILNQWDYGASQRSWTIRTSAVSPYNQLNIRLSANGSSEGKRYTTSAAIFDNEWHYIGFTWGSGVLTVYVDGVEAEVTKGDDAVIASLHNSTANLTAGAELNNGTPAAFFNGSIDDARVYSYARTADEVRADYNDGLAARLGKSNQDLNRGLIGYWDFEEGGGQIVKDKSGNSNHGTLGSSSSVDSADPVFTSGFNSAGSGGTGLKFDGVDDYVDCGNGQSYDTTNAFSVSAWVYAKDTENYRRIFSKTSSIVGTIFIYSNNLYWYDANINGGSHRIMISNAFVNSADSWKHIALTWQSDGTIKAFVDGTSRPFTLIQGNWTGTAGISSNNFYMGKYSTTQFFDGSIDEARVYNRALSEDEIRQLYNQKKPVLHLKMDEGSGNVAYDESFNRNHGALGGGTAANMPSWTQGKYGSALSFDGSDDYISIADTNSLDIAGKFTLEGWIYPTELNLEDCIFSKGGSSACGNYDLYLYNGKLALISTASCNWAYAGGNSSVVMGEWQHIAASYDGTNVNYYINGVLKDSKAWGGIGTINTGSLEIGKQQASAEGDFGGKMDDLRIYNYARTPEEIRVDYNSGLAARLR